MKVRALPSFEGIRDNERTKIEGKDVFPKAGDEWEVSEERGLFLQKNGVVEIVGENKNIIEATIITEPIMEVKKEEPVEYLSEPEIKEEKSKKKKTSKK